MKTSGPYPHQLVPGSAIARLRDDAAKNKRRHRQSIFRMHVLSIHRARETAPARSEPLIHLYDMGVLGPNVPNGALYDVLEPKEQGQIIIFVSLEANEGHGEIVKATTRARKTLLQLGKKACLTSVFEWTDIDRKGDAKVVRSGVQQFKTVVRVCLSRDARTGRGWTRAHAFVDHRFRASSFLSLNPGFVTIQGKSKRLAHTYIAW